MEPILTLKNVQAAYDGVPALQGVNLTFGKNRITAILGPSGCGKSTLLRAMNRMLEEEPGAKAGGTVLLDNTDIQTLPREEVRRRIGLVFQTPSPFPFSIRKNITYAPQYYGMHDKQQLETLVKEKLRQAGLYDEVKDDLGKNAAKLSGGQQQRLCIARALSAEPEVLLLDEPCSALDVKSTAVIEDTLLSLKAEYSIVLVTHNIAEAKRIADDVVFLYNGHVAEAGEKSAFFAHPQTEEARAFIDGIYG